MYLIGLFKVRSHFCQDFVGGDSDIYCKSQLIPTLFGLLLPLLQGYTIKPGFRSYP